MDQPRAAQRPHRMERHEDVRIDEYYWLNDRENPEVIDYLNAENATVRRAWLVQSLWSTYFMLR